MTADPRTMPRLRAAFGALLDALMDEAPERTAWGALPFPEVEGAIERARARIGEPGHALGFRTLLKQELDDTCGLSPAPMGFERATLPAQRMWNARERRNDERSRATERREVDRRNDLIRQARDLLTPSAAPRRAAGVPSDAADPSCRDDEG